jgi:hypothetical protein
MDQIEEALNRYEEDLRKAKEGRCEKVSRCADFREGFRKDYLEIYKSKLEEVRAKLINKNHAAKMEEKPSEELFYGFTLAIVPRHLFEPPSDRYFPNSLWSIISFTANEHTLTVDVETVVRPNIERREHHTIEKITKDEFNEEMLMQKVKGFLAKVFDETIILDLTPSNLTDR